MDEVDWTVDEEGRSNSSAAYLKAVMAVEGIIRRSGYTLMSGGVHQVARNIVSTLVWDHRLAPTRPDAGTDS